MVKLKLDVASAATAASAIALPHEPLYIVRNPDSPTLPGHSARDDEFLCPSNLLLAAKLLRGKQSVNVFGVEPPSKTPYSRSEAFLL